MVFKKVKYIIRIVEGKIIRDIVGKKYSIIKLCMEGKLHPRKCRKYEV